MRFLAVVAVSTLLIVAGCTASAPRRDAAGDEADFARQIVVTVPQRRELSTALLGAPQERYRLRRGYEAAPAVERTLQQLAGEHDLKRIQGWPIASLDVYCEVFEVGPGASIDALLSELASDSRVDLAQRMNVFETLAPAYDDTYADLQPAMLDLELEAAHRLATGRDVTVAVIDSGVDTRHPELRERVVLRRDLVGSRPAPSQGEVHGTAVAGVIASSANNAQGIVGVAPEVSLAVLRACWATADGSPDARCSTLTLAQALELALRLEPDVVNLSLSGPHDPLLTRLMERVVERGIVVVTARPAAPSQTRRFPSSEPGVLVAEASTAAPAQGAFPWLVGAPGEEILTTTPASEYAFLSGSSLAAAHVSGIAALLLERSPELEPGRIAAILRETATQRQAGMRVNACRALARLVLPAAECAGLSEVVSLDDVLRTTN